jgi:transcriptional regulator with XRE-family HTH domain
MNRIRELRKKKNITMRELGSKLGLAESTISLLETGKRDLNSTILQKLADFFEVSIDYLLGREKEFDGLNIIQRPLDTRKTDIQIAFDAMNERQQNKLLDYARGLLAGEDINLDELLRRAK